MRRATLVFLGALACGSDDAGAGTSTGADTTTADDDPSTPDDDDDDDDGDPSSGGDSSTSGTTTLDPSTTTTATGSTTDDLLDDNGCPSTAPSEWIACESFDAITDAPTQLSQWNVNADGFAVEAGVGDGGTQALRVRLQPDVMFGGWVTLRFGEGPDAPSIDSPRGRWDEVWVRYRLRTGADWPGRQIGDVGELIAMNGANWGIAADLNVQGDGGMRVHPFGWTCIVDGALVCDGMNDWVSGVQTFWNEAGTTQVFDVAHADAWQCFEAHLKLNAPGASDGEAHVWIDDTLEVEELGIDWRGTWDDFGINAVRFTNYADPVDAPLDFYVDDVVVATARVGC